jgi:hypothetical protein
MDYNEAVLYLLARCGVPCVVATPDIAFAGHSRRCQEGDINELIWTRGVAEDSHGFAVLRTALSVCYFPIPSPACPYAGSDFTQRCPHFKAQLVSGSRCLGNLTSQSHDRREQCPCQNANLATVARL